jgi:hypothetical protein
MADQSSEPELRVESRMLQLLWGYKTTQAIAVVARLGIADLVTVAPKTVEELVRETKTHAPSLRRVLQFLTNFGIFAEDADGKYRQTELSKTLRRDAQRSYRGAAIMFGSDFYWRIQGDLMQTITTGQPAPERVLGATAWDYLAAHPDDAAIANAAFASLSSMQLSEILETYDFSRFERIVDVGGGQGMLLHGILSACPRLHGVLADQPSVVAGASAFITGPIAARCEVVGIDFFQSVPEGADAYVAKNVIVDWSDEDAIRILKNCRRAIRHDGTMLLIEPMLRPANQFDFAKFSDLEMLAATHGRARTEAEFRALLAEAGFALSRAIPTTGTLSIVESKPV